MRRWICSGAKRLTLINLCADRAFCPRNRQNRVKIQSREPTFNDRAQRDAALLAIRVDAVAALPAGAAQGRIHLGDRRVFLPRHRAGRCHPHHRDGGDERLPQGIARQDSRPQRPSLDPAVGKAAHRLGGRLGAHRRRQGHPARCADRRRPGAGVLAVQRRRRTHPRHPLEGPGRAAVGHQQHKARHAERLRRGPRRGDRPPPRRPALTARRRQPHAGGAARRRHTHGHDAAHQGLQDRRRVRDRHVGIRLGFRVHAAEGGAGLFQPRRRRDRHRGLYRRSRPNRQLPQGGAGSQPSARSS